MAEQKRIDKRKARQVAPNKANKPFRTRIGNKRRVSWVWKDDMMVPVKSRN